MAGEEPKMPYLPIDMIWEIFLRLPSKPLRRFRAVCRAWRDLGTEHYLLLAHRRRQPSDLLLHCRTSAQGGPPSPLDYMNFRVDALDLRAGIIRIRPVVLFTEPTHPLISSVLRIHGSCGGLLLISFTDNLAYTERLDLCNPATHQWAPLPQIDTYNIVGLYRHGQDYRVLYDRGFRANRTYLIFSMTSRQIKDIGCPLASKSDADAVAWLNRGPMPAYLKPPVLLRGNLHWPPQSVESTILVFDTSAEDFRSMPTSIQPGLVSSLFDMDGTLAMSSRRKEHPVFVDLWLLQNYEMETWVRSYSFKFKPEVERISFVVSQQGDVLVNCFTDGLWWYDKGGNLKGVIEDDRGYLSFTQFLLKESLVPLPQQFFEHIVIDDVPAPPYFRGPWP